MKPYLFFFLAGVVVGVVVFWGPTALGQGSNFHGILFFTSVAEIFPWVWTSPWLAALPYCFAGVILFGLYGVFTYWTKKKKHPARLLYPCLFFSAGLYLSLSISFLMLGAALSGGGS